jgi:adenylate cyclase
MFGASISYSTRRKLLSIAMAGGIFAVLAGLITVAIGRPLEYGVGNGILTGIGVGAFEELYVQNLRGRWLRTMHPLRSIFVYTLVVVLIYLVALHITHLVLGRWDNWFELPVVYRRLHFAIAHFVLFSIIAISAMRVVHFIGIENLFHLMVGTYHRPVQKRIVFMFVDINGSTAIAGQLGAFRMGALVGKFLFDIGKPITDAGGDIYLYKGDGLIATWNWEHAVHGNAILRAIDAMHAAVRRERQEYLHAFGVAPMFRVGVHGGDVVMSVQGDTKRSIGVYGDTINIAARMEEAAKAHGVFCVISADVVQALDNRNGRILPLAEEYVRGLDDPILVAEYRPEGGASAPLPGF